MDAKELNELKKAHNALWEEGASLYDRVISLHDEIVIMRKKIKNIEGADHDPIELLFNGTFTIQE